MRALSLAGLYAPWTGEALYDDTAPAAGQPFTAVHELMHMGGVADEGQANIHAYIACQRYGGAFAYSADLWALKYAAEALLALDAQACAARLSALGDAARRDLSALGLSAAEPAAPRFFPPPSPKRRATTARWPRGWRRVSYESVEKRAH